MSTITVLADETATVGGRWVDGRPVVDGPDLATAIGWELKPEGLCRDEVCVPVRDRSTVEHDGGIDVAAAAEAVGRAALVDEASGSVVIGRPSSLRQQALRDRQAPEFVLPDLDGVDRALSDLAGKKRLLVAFASW